MKLSLRIAFDAACFLSVVCLFSSNVHAQERLFNAFPAGARSPTMTFETSRTISGHQGTDDVLAFRLSVYGTPSENMPLLVQVHEWGGSFQRQEDIATYAPDEYDFLMLYFQYVPSSGNEDDWWFGTHWDGECHMWAHHAVMDIVREAIDTTLAPDRLSGATVDRNRVYVFGHSIGGTGAWQLGIRNPDVFAAFHAHSGFARFTPPNGAFEELFSDRIVGAEADGVILRDPHSDAYPARDYSDLAWWLTSYADPSLDTPFAFITAGTGDDAVPIASGGDLMRPVLESQRRGFHYNRHDGGHAADAFIQLNWMWNLRLDQSFLALTNSSTDTGAGNDAAILSWTPSSIVDERGRYEVLLVGDGTADVTPRRLQRFEVVPLASYRYWIDTDSGEGELVSADQYGLLTIPSISGGHRLIIEPDEPPPWEEAEPQGDAPDWGSDAGAHDLIDEPHGDLVGDDMDRDVSSDGSLDTDMGVDVQDDDLSQDAPDTDEGGTDTADAGADSPNEQPGVGLSVDDDQQNPRSGSDQNGACQQAGSQPSGTQLVAVIAAFFVVRRRPMRRVVSDASPGKTLCPREPMSPRRARTMKE